MQAITDKLLGTRPDYARRRARLRRCGIIRRIAKRGVESSEKLGRHRWVVERTHG